ncbi:MAG: nucleotidyltransferase family protein [Bacteroidales bacterium]|nr:nucleotidyltransferase family protein [Bacteroidales bacterium]
MKSKIKELFVFKNSSIIFALKQMDSIGRKLLIVLEDDKYVGLLSIGDIQRAIIKNIDLNLHVSSINRDDYIIANKYHSMTDVKKMMLYIRSEFMPVVDDDKNLIDVYFWEDLFGEKKIEPKAQFNLPVVIMAGGIGTRLRPLTNVLPKPLLPIGTKTMLEEIFERFANYGSNRFYISINYKADLIKYYIQNQHVPYDINFFEEEKPMGTAGSLTILKGSINQTFFVSNCDILIEQDYSEILSYHKENNNEITLVAALKHYPIPYGTVETGKNGKLIALKEKPEITFKINSGMYILEPHLLNEIPENVFFHITQLIENVKNRNGNIGVFPVSERSWKDIGNWDEYLKFF